MIKQVLLDLYVICRKYRRDPFHDDRRERLVVDGPIEHDCRELPSQRVGDETESGPRRANSFFIEPSVGAGEEVNVSRTLRGHGHAEIGRPRVKFVDIAEMLAR